MKLLFETWWNMAKKMMKHHKTLWHFMNDRKTRHILSFALRELRAMSWRMTFKAETLRSDSINGVIYGHFQGTRLQKGIVSNVLGSASFATHGFQKGKNKNVWFLHIVKYPRKHWYLDVVLDCSSFSGPGSCWVDVGCPLPRRRVHAWLLPPLLQSHKPLPARSHRFSPTTTNEEGKWWQMMENDGKWWKNGDLKARKM